MSIDNESDILVYPGNKPLLCVRRSKGYHKLKSTDFFALMCTN